MKHNLAIKLKKIYKYIVQSSVYMQKILYLFILLNISFFSFGYDAELNESRKCINIFRALEQKLDLPEDVLFAIGLHETKKIHSIYKKPIAWPWTANVKGKSYYFKNKREAVNFVKTNIKQGNTNIDVGCMQVNLKHHPNAFRSIEQAFTQRYQSRLACRSRRSPRTRRRQFRRR